MITWVNIIFNWHLHRSVQFSCSVVSNSLRPHESQHARPPCPSPTPRDHSDSCPLSQWCHPAISSSVVPFSSCPQSLPASESFPMSQLIAWGGQSTGVSALASFLPKKSQGWSPSEWKSINSSALSLLHSPTLTSIHDHWKNHSLIHLSLSKCALLSKTEPWLILHPHLTSRKLIIRNTKGPQ